MVMDGILRFGAGITAASLAKWRSLWGKQRLSSLVPNSSCLRLKCQMKV